MILQRLLLLGYAFYMLLTSNMYYVIMITRKPS